MQVSGITLATLLAIACGGSIGAVSRYLISHWALQRFGEGFSWGTFIANATGALLVGLVYALIQHKLLESAVWGPLLMAGFLGALTTFSTFSLEVLLLLQYGAWLRASVYIAVSLFVCVSLAWLGMRLAALFA